MNDIYERLKAGESMDDIAAEFTALLNSAQERYKQDQEAEAKAEKRAQRRVELAGNVLTALNAYMNEIHSDIGFDTDAMTAEEMADVLDKGIEDVKVAMKVANDIADSFKTLSDNMDKAVKCSKNRKGDKSDNLFDELSKWLF